MKLNRQYFRLVTALFVILLVLQACSGSGDSQQKNQGGGQRGQRAAAEAMAKPFRSRARRLSALRFSASSNFPASLISPDQVRVSSEVDGTVSSVDAELGQEVRAGQILIQFDTRELQLAVERAESALRQTEAQLGIDSARPGVIPPDEQIASVRTAIANREDARVKLAQTQELVNKGLVRENRPRYNETRLKVAEASCSPLWRMFAL